MKHIFNIPVIIFLIVILCGNVSVISNAQLTPMSNQEPLNGVVMKGIYVNLKQNTIKIPSAPPNYIENSLQDDL